MTSARHRTARLVAAKTCLFDYLMMFGRQGLHGHAKIMADLSSPAEAPPGCHVQLDGR